jgi:SpoVK/Ycf46/Vps4 family AAA+-type ATPase
MNHIMNKSAILGIGGILTTALYIYNKNNKNNEQNYISDVKKNKNVTFREKDNLIFHHKQEHFNQVLKYLYDEYGEHIHNFTCNNKQLYNYTEYRARRREKPTPQRVKIPSECDLSVDYEYNGLVYKVDVDIKFEKNDNKCIKLNGTHEEREELLRTITLTSHNKDILYDFLDKAIEHCDNEAKLITKTNNNSMLVYYFKSEFWQLLSKVPKRDSNTVFLKENMKEEIFSWIDTFLEDGTRDKYIKHGIPYKNVYLIYGPPGTGKTSLIRSIASDFDCDLFVLPITKRMEDHHMIDAITGIQNMSETRDNKHKVIVMEDIDTIFDKRKDGDTENGITLQCLLNMMDGFTCVEGTLLFLTANRPELFDTALLRSGRVDKKIKLDYSDKYQMKNMFESYFPEQLDSFENFYNNISHLKLTSAVLQEFFFKHDGCEDILLFVNEINTIVENNDCKNFELLEDSNKNIYC